MNVLSDVYDFALTATAATLRESLANEKTTARASVALRAVASAFNSDVQGAIALLRRGLTIDSSLPGDEAAYIRDLLIMFLCQTGEFGAFAETLHEPATIPPRLQPAFWASEAILHAVAGEHAPSRAAARDAMTAARAMDAPLILGRALARCSVAAYYRGDYDEAREIALESAHLFEAREAYASASTSYSVAAAVAQDWSGDGALALAHFSRMLGHAERAGYNAVLRSALAACFNVAAEMHDVETFSSMRKRLMSRPEREQHQEKYILLISDALGYGWKGDFTAAETVLNAYAASRGISEPQAALVDALLALVAAARWDVGLARTRSRSALRRTAPHRNSEALHDQRFRELARVLAAEACFIIGDQVRGQRALSARFDAGHRYRDILTGRTIDLARCPELFRGYAEFVNAAAASANAARPKHRLTSTELQILRALPHGLTIAELALERQKSKSTIARQVESIYHKLSARNRAQAIQNAREFGVI